MNLQNMDENCKSIIIRRDIFRYGSRFAIIFKSSLRKQALLDDSETRKRIYRIRPPRNAEKNPQNINNKSA